MLLYLLIFLVAFSYSMVGHGGASGYLAVLALFGYNPSQMAQSALFLNLLVSSTALIAYGKAGYFKFKLFFPFVLTSIPFAFIGGTFNIHYKIYKWLLFFALIFTSSRLAFLEIINKNKENDIIKSPNIYISLLTGAIIGLISGMIGIGGGIFLSPILILMKWADAKTTAAISAAFILVNSLSGLTGQILYKGLQIKGMWQIIMVAFTGGLIGSFLGSHHAKDTTIRRVLAIVLFIAAFKMII